MVRWRKSTGWAVLLGAAISGLPADVPAATSSTLDIISNDRAGDTDSVDIGRVTPIARPNRETVRPLPGGNPLWSIPLSALSATQERPIFSASRRPPQRAVVAPAEQAETPPPPPAAEPERPALALIGAVVGDGDAIAVFLDRSSQKIVRLRQGEAHSGWVLSSVQGREVTLKKAERSEVLVLQRQETPAAAPAGPALPAPVIPASNSNTSFAPFTPRSTPKNGESDGL